MAEQRFRAVGRAPYDRELRVEKPRRRVLDPRVRAAVALTGAMR